LQSYSKKEEGRYFNAMKNTGHLKKTLLIGGKDKASLTERIVFANNSLVILEKSVVILF